MFAVKPAEILLKNHSNKLSYSKENSKKVLKINSNIKSILVNYIWPGNVRELENFMHRLVIMSEDAVTIDDIPAYMKMKVPKLLSTENETLAEVEKRHIDKVLKSVDNNKTKAAEILGIDRKTLRQKLKND